MSKRNVIPKHLKYVKHFYIGGCEISSIESTVRFVLFTILVIELLTHFCLSQGNYELKSDRDYQNYNIKGTIFITRQSLTFHLVTMEEDQDEGELTEKLKTRLEKYIQDEKDLNKCMNGILDDFRGFDPDDLPSPEAKIPYEKDEYLPWQESMVEPANPFSLATMISTKTIKKPELPAYSP